MHVRPLSSALIVLCICLISSSVRANVIDRKQAVLQWQSSEEPAPLQEDIHSSNDTRAERLTLVDLLSADPKHSLLIQLLQRARLINTLNKLNGSTLFAPTNDAISAAAAVADSVWAYGVSGQPVDNIQAELRSRLLYHMLNYTLPYDISDAPAGVHMHESLLFPHPQEGTGAPGQPPDGDEDLFPGELLAGEGQKLRTVREKGGLRIGTNAKGEGGAPTIGSGRRAINGVLISIGGVLEPPKSIGEIVESHPSLRELAKLLPAEVRTNLSAQPHITLFAPSDKSWSSLSQLEWRYLNSGFAQSDLLEILGDHTRSRPRRPGSIGYLSRLTDDEGKGELRTDSGNALVVAEGSHGVRINASRIVEGDILASNGVIHIVDALLLSSDSLELTVEKTLVALNTTLFVAAIRSANLSRHLQHRPHDGPKQTVLAFQDGAAELEWVVLPEPGTAALTNTLQYHLVDGAWKPAALGHNQLLDTALKPDSLRGAPQKLQVFRPEGYDKDDRDDIVFGNANVVSGPCASRLQVWRSSSTDSSLTDEVGNSIVYVLGQILEPPPQVLEVAMTNLRLSTFAASVYAAEWAHILRRAAGTTVFAPTNEAFETLGLILAYLLLPSAKPELRQVLAYHAARSLLYFEANTTSSQSYDTLEGSPIYIERFNATTQVHGPTLAGFPVNGDLQNASVLPSSEAQLTNTGVLHVLDQVELPPDLTINLVKLLRGAKGTTMIEMLKLANMSWVLNGEPRPEPPSSTASDSDEDYQSMGRRKKQRQLQKRLFERYSYTILCPSDKAFSRLNLTYYRSNIEALQELLELHVIRSEPPSKSAINDPSRFPSRGRPIALSDSAVYATLLSERSQYGDVAFRAFGSGQFVVGVKGANGASASDNFASIVGYGRATPNFVGDGTDEMSALSPRMAFGGGVLALDSVLTPYHPTWYYRWGWIVVVVVLSVLAAVLLCLFIWKLFIDHKAAKAYSRLEGEED